MSSGHPDVRGLEVLYVVYVMEVSKADNLPIFSVPVQSCLILQKYQFQCSASRVYGGWNHSY